MGRWTDDGSRYIDHTVEVMGSKTIEITLANAVAIVDTSGKFYNLATISGLSNDEIRQYKEWKISISHTHNAAGDVKIYTANNAAGAGITTPSGQVYSETGVLTSGTYDLLYGAPAGGTGVDARYKVVPTLKGVHSNIIIRIGYAVAPTSGSLTIKLEGVR